MQIYLDGEWHGRETAKVSVFDHGLLYGDGVFEGIRVYPDASSALEAHLDRLYDSAKALALDIPLTADAMADVGRRDGPPQPREDAYIRLVVTRGVGDLGIDPRSCPTPERHRHRHRHSRLPAELYAAASRSSPRRHGRCRTSRSTPASSRSTTSRTCSPSSMRNRPAPTRRSCSTPRASSPSAPPTTSSSSARSAADAVAAGRRPRRHHARRRARAGRARRGIPAARRA